MNIKYFANLIQAWENARERGGEAAEMNLCEQRGLNASTLRTTWEAKNQLKGLLTSQGFPEECMGAERRYNFHGEDPQLDTVIGILALGLYPNVCMHKEKRKVLTTEAKAALIHKSSVNMSREAISFPSPFFVFGEKIRTRAVSCKQMTMVTPLHLMLFASRKVEMLHNGTIRVDNWINLDMDPYQAAIICALRPAIETLVTAAASTPDSDAAAKAHESAVLCLREICRVNAGVDHGNIDKELSCSGVGDGPPPSKRGNYPG